MAEKTYIAYAIHYGEQSCGCPSTSYSHCYDRTGNLFERFKTREEAETAAKAKMKETNADNWQVI